MKIVAVLKSNCDLGPRGQILHVASPEEIVNRARISDCLLIEVEDSFDVSIHDLNLAEDDSHAWTLSPSKKAAALAVGKEILVSQAYDRMNDDVYTEMENVFGTKKSDSATAFLQTWKEMVQDPAFFVSANNPNLNTEEKVLAYANGKIEQAKNYSKWRMSRIEQFQAEKATILNN